MSIKHNIAAGVFGLLLSSPTWAQAAGQPAPAPAMPLPPSTVRTPPAEIPLSSYASAQVREALEKLKSAPPEPSFADTDALRRYHEKQTDEILSEARRLYAVTVTPKTLGGVKADVVVPQAGVSADNRDRVLINLHGGAFMFGAGSGGLVESVPIAATGRIKVVTVDYRMAPEHRFPAASEDVAAVYRELLKTYRPENIGLYGCSAGGILAAEAVAWFSKHGLPRPGAIASLCGTGAEFGGDSGYLAALLIGIAVPPGTKPLQLVGLPYFAGVDPHDPLVFPVESPQVLAKFPPTLLLAGSRDFAASSLTVMHRRLHAAGVESELFLFDGLWHAFMMLPALPESQEAYAILDRFFDRHLGRRALGAVPAD